MKKLKKDPIREERIDNQAIVDATDPDEQRDGMVLLSGKPDSISRSRPGASQQISSRLSAKVKPPRSFAWRQKMPACTICSC